MKRKGNGFTLIELLVVISIMAILTIITVSQFMTARMRARDVARKGDLNALSKALQMYYADYGVFPAKINEGINSNEWAGEFKDPNDANYTYMKVLPVESGNRNLTVPYCYVVSADKKKFGLFASLENVNDSDYSGPYIHCGGKSYYYSVVSPNTTAEDDELELVNQ